MKKFLKSAAKIAGGIVGAACTLTVLLLLVAVIYIMTCNMRGRIATVFGTSVMKVVTGSMEPSIHTGDYILIDKTDVSSLKVGDVICFYSEDEDIYGMPNTHRIVGIREDGSFVTKGDANEFTDSTAVKPERVIGIYSGKARFLRWINSFTSQKKLLTLLVIIPMLAVAVYEVRTITKIRVECAEEKKAAAVQERERRIREAIEAEKAKLYVEKYKSEETEVSAENESRENTES